MLVVFFLLFYFIIVCITCAVSSRPICITCYCGSVSDNIGLFALINLICLIRYTEQEDDW